METFGLVLIAGLLLALAGIAVVVFARKVPRRPVAEPSIDPADVAELDEIFARITEESAHDSLMRLEQRLLRMSARGAPLRYVRPAAGPGRARLGFADGTVVVGRGQEPSSLGLLARHANSGKVRPGRVRLQPDRIELELSWPGGRLIVDVLGADQAD